MKATEKKFQIITVGADLMTDEYLKWLEQKGYELSEVKIGVGTEIKSYTFKLKGENNESQADK